MEMRRAPARGSCFYCGRGLSANCENTSPNGDRAAGVHGYSHVTGGYEGGQAEYVRVPFADVGPMKLPDDMAEEEVLFLSDIFPTGYQAAEMGEIEGGETVVVFGCGPVGLFGDEVGVAAGRGARDRGRTCRLPPGVRASLGRGTRRATA